MLHCALIGLKPGKFQPLSRVNRRGNRHHIFGRLNAATPCATINFNETFNLGSVLYRGRWQISDIRQIINTANCPRAQFWQTCQPVNFRRITNLIRHQNILDTATHKRLSFADLLAANATTAAKLFLKQRHINRFMHLAMNAVTHILIFGELTHLDDIAL